MPEKNIIKSPLLELMFRKKRTDEFLLPLVQAETRILPDWWGKDGKEHINWKQFTR